MKKLLKEFRSHLLDRVLDFLWAQWSTLGVPGHARFEQTRIVDPEALILLTCSLGRNDARLFDEMLDWISLHERLVQIQRLKNMARDEKFTGLPVLRAVGAWMSHNKAGVKWRRLMELDAASTEAEVLFCSRDGKPLPVVKEPDPVFERHGFLRDKISLRRHAQIFDPELPSNLLIRLRAFFGVNSRAEVMTYLLTHERAGAAEIAQATYYYKRTVYNALSEMRLSGMLQLWEWGTENLYSPKGDLWRGFRASEWMTWAPLFRALEHIWKFAESMREGDIDEQLAATDLNVLIRDISPLLQKANLLGHLQMPTPGVDKGYVDRGIGGLKGILELMVAG